MKKVIVEIDGREVEYSTITACAKALGVTVSTVRDGAAYGYKCKGMTLRYADGTRRLRKSYGKSGWKATTPDTLTDLVSDDVSGLCDNRKGSADYVAGLVARWYISEWQGEYVSSEALASLIKFLRDNLGSDPK